MKRHKRFSAVRHIPHYSSLLFQLIQTPLLVYFALAGNFVTLVSALLFYSLEHARNPSVHGLFDAVWWAFCTVSTVGFGDITPVTVGGRLVGIFLMITGIGFFVGFTAVLVSLVSTVSTTESEELTVREHRELLREIRTLSEKVDRIAPRPAPGPASDGNPERRGAGSS